MKNLGYFIVLAVLLASCGRPGSNESSSSEDDTIAVVVSNYKDDLYDQGHTNACWIYAMCACIEQEQLRYGDSVTLSRQWLMSHLLEEQAIDYYLTNGSRNISMRGVGPEVLRLIHEYGLVPYNMERSHINNSNVLERKLRLMAETSAPSPSLGRGGNSIYALRSRIKALLPRFTLANYDSNYLPPMGAVRDGAFPHNGGDGAAPSFYYYSMRYTPWQFAQSIMYDQQWQFYASEAIHQWHQPFALEVPDNYRYHQFMNVPMDELYDMVVHSLKNHHPVYWEYGKESRDKTGGMASSDHAMAIVALIPHNSLPKGNIQGDAFLCLNSYGKDWGDHGYCFVSKQFFMKHTCDVGLVNYIPASPLSGSIPPQAR